MSRVAVADVAFAVYVPDGVWLDGVAVDAPTWAMPGRHTLRLEFAQAQEALGMLEIDSVDGVPALWGSCCGGC